MTDLPPAIQPWDPINPQIRPAAPGSNPPPVPDGPPAAYPAHGFQVPAGAMHLYDLSALYADPLVTVPGETINGWWSRLWKTVRRSWRSVLSILVLTSAVPGLMFAYFLAHASATLSDSMLHTPRGQLADGTGAVYETLFIYLAVSSFLNGIGWSAAIWTITKQAVGEPTRFDSAMIFGLRNGLRVGGWLLLYGLIVVVGSVCCVLPGLYILVACSLVVPMAIFRTGALSDSFTMVNSNFGRVLGRMSILIGFVAAAGVVAAVIGLVAGWLAGADIFEQHMITGIIGSVLVLPSSVLLITGTLLTYAEMRARSYLTTAADLSSAL